MVNSAQLRQTPLWPSSRSHFWKPRSGNPCPRLPSPSSDAPLSPQRRPLSSLRMGGPEAALRLIQGLATTPGPQAPPAPVPQTRSAVSPALAHGRPDPEETLAGAAEGTPARLCLGSVPGPSPGPRPRGLGLRPTAVPRPAHEHAAEALLFRNRIPGQHYLLAPHNLSKSIQRPTGNMKGEALVTE